MKAARNIAIIAALAVAVAFVPGGGNAANTILAALNIGFLAGIAWFAYTMVRQNQFTLSTLNDSQRILLFGAAGLIVLMIAGTDEMFSSGPGTLAWLLLMGLAAAAIWRVVLEARSY